MVLVKRKIVHDFVKHLTGEKPDGRRAFFKSQQIKLFLCIAPFFDRSEIFGSLDADGFSGDVYKMTVAHFLDMFLADHLDP